MEINVATNSAKEATEQTENGNWQPNICNLQSRGRARNI